MEFINYSLTAILTFLGLVIGYVMALFTKEELRPGKKYFVPMKYVICYLIILILFYYSFSENLMFSLILSIVLFVSLSIYLYLLKINVKAAVNLSKNESYIDYLFLPIVLFLSTKNTDLFIVESALIFIYGFPVGTLLEYKKEPLINIFKHAYYILIAIVLPLLFSNF